MIIRGDYYDKHAQGKKKQLILYDSWLRSGLEQRHYHQRGLLRQTRIMKNGLQDDTLLRTVLGSGLEQRHQGQNVSFLGEKRGGKVGCDRALPVGDCEGGSGWCL
jgi:hypothetical protein